MSDHFKGNMTQQARASFCVALWDKVILSADSLMNELSIADVMSTITDKVLLTDIKHRGYDDLRCIKHFDNIYSCHRVCLLKTPMIYHVDFADSDWILLTKMKSSNSSSSTSRSTKCIDGSLSSNSISLLQLLHLHEIWPVKLLIKSFSNRIVPEP
jgi:hypothetical protein